MQLTNYFFTMFFTHEWWPLFLCDSIFLKKLKSLTLLSSVYPCETSKDTSFGNAGGLLFSMGLLGYLFSKSNISLVLGVVPGFVTLLLGTLSLKVWRRGKSSVVFILAQAGEKNIIMLSRVLRCIWITVQSLLFLEYMLLMDLIYFCFCSNFCFPGMEVLSCVLLGNYYYNTLILM
jgi:uncharacterized membrane protein (UPF0136 family)